MVQFYQNFLFHTTQTLAKNYSSARGRKAEQNTLFLFRRIFWWRARKENCKEYFAWRRAGKPVGSRAKILKGVLGEEKSLPARLFTGDYFKFIKNVII